MSVDELQAELDAAFPHGAHVWIQQSEGPDLTYLCPRPIAATESILSVVPASIDRDVLVTFTDHTVGDGEHVFSGPGRVLHLTTGFEPSEALDRLRRTYDQGVVDALRARFS